MVKAMVNLCVMAKKKQLPKYQDGERYLKNPFVRRKPMRVKDLDSYEKNQYGTLEDDRFYLESFPPPRRDASGKYYHPVIRDPETGELTRVHNLPITSISGRKASDSSEMAMDTKTGKMTSNTHNVDWSKSQAGNKILTGLTFAAAAPANLGLKATSKLGKAGLFALDALINPGMGFGKLGKAGVKTLDALINPGMARKPMISWRSLKPKSRYVKAKQLVDAKLEGEQWVKDWYDDPYTKNRIKNIEMPEIQSPIFDNELSKVEFATNPDFIGSSNFFGEEVLNRGRSFSNGEVYVNPNMPRNQIRSTTIHELTHNKTRNESNYVIDVLVKRAMDKSKAASDYDNYLLDPAEVYARIAQIRFTHNIKPSDIVSDKQIDKIIKSNKGLVDNRFFKLIKDKSAFKDLFNLLPAVAGTGAVGIGAAQAGNKEYQQGGITGDPPWKKKTYSTIEDAPYKEKELPIKTRQDFKGNFLSKTASGGVRRDSYGKLGDLYRYFGGLDLKHDVLYNSKYKPSNSKDPNAKYIAIQDSAFRSEILSNANRIFNANKLKEKESKINENTYTVNLTNWGKNSSALGNVFISRGEDENGKYISYYDVFDRETGAIGKDGFDFNATKPFEVYDRIYIDTDKTGNAVERKSFQQGGVVTSKYGQWKYPGQVTKVPSGDITMEGVNYPVLGVSDSGDRQMMYPGGNYHFKGKSVIEYPILPKMQGGGQLPKYQLAGETPKETYQDEIEGRHYGMIFGKPPEGYSKPGRATSKPRNISYRTTPAIEDFSLGAVGSYNANINPFLLGDPERRKQEFPYTPTRLGILEEPRSNWGEPTIDKTINQSYTDMYDFYHKPTTSSIGLTANIPLKTRRSGAYGDRQVSYNPTLSYEQGQMYKWNPYYSQQKDINTAFPLEGVDRTNAGEFIPFKGAKLENEIQFKEETGNWVHKQIPNVDIEWNNVDRKPRFGFGLKAEEEYWDNKNKNAYTASLGAGWQPYNGVSADMRFGYKRRIGKNGILSADVSNPFWNTNSKVNVGYTHKFQQGGETNSMLDNIYKKYPALKRMGKTTVVADPSFTSKNTGVGSIEYFSPNPYKKVNETFDMIEQSANKYPETRRGSIRYNNGFVGEHPNTDTHGVRYDPNDNNEQDVMLDMLHGMTKDPVYAKHRKDFGNTLMNSKWGEDLHYNFQMDMDRTKKTLLKQGKSKKELNSLSEDEFADKYMDGKDQWKQTWLDGVIRNLMFEGTPEDFEKAKYWDGLEDLYFQDENVKKSFGQLKNYLKTGKGYMLPEYEVTATRDTSKLQQGGQFNDNDMKTKKYKKGGKLPKYYTGGPFIGNDYIGDMSQYDYDTGIWNGTDHGGSYGQTDVLNSANGYGDDFFKGAGKSALSMAGAGAGIGATFGPVGAIIGGGAGALIGGTIGGIQGLKAAKAEDEVIQRKQDMMEKQSLAYQPRGTRMYKQGGQAMANPNAELEQQEGVQTPDGETFNVNGAPHEQGGIEMALEQGSRIFSDDESMALPDGRTPAQVFKQLSKKLDFYKKNAESGATLAKQTAKAMISSIEKKIDELWQYQEQVKQSQGSSQEGLEGEIMGQEGNYYPETENVPPEAIYQEGGIGPLSPWEIQKLKGTYLKEPKDRENHAIQSFKSTYETETGKKMTSTQEAKLREEYLTNGTARGELTGTEETYLFPTQPYMSETRTSNASKINPSNRDVYTPEEWSVAAKETGDYRLKEYNDAVKKHITSPTSSPYFKRGGKLPKYQQGDIYTSEDERLNKIARNAISRSTNPYYTGLSGNYTILKDPTWPPAATQQQGIDLSTPRGYRPQGVGGGNNAFIAEDQIGDGYQVPGDPPKVPPYLANIAPYFGGQQQASGGIDPRIITENGQMRLYANTGTEGEDLRQLAIDTWGDVGAKTNIQGEDLYYYPTGAGETEVAGTKKKSTQLAKNKYVPTTADATTEQPMEHGVPVSDKPLSELTAGLSANLRQTGNPAIPLGEKIPFTGTPSTEMGDNQFDWKSLIPYASRIPGMVNALRKMKVPEAEQAKQIAYKDQVFDPYPIQAAAQTAKDAVSANSNYAPVTRGIQLGLEGQKQKSLNEGQAGVNKLNFVGRNQVNQSNQRTDMFNTQARNTKNMTQFAADQQRLQNIDMATRDVGDIYMKQQFEKAVMERDVTSIRLYTDSLIKNGATWEKIRPSLVGMLDDDVLREYDAKYKDK
jgi:hypothetical protein